MHNYDLIRKIKESNRIEDVAREFGIELKNNKALCPFHKERRASFSVEPSRQIARCFGCMDRAVDVIGLVMKFKNISFGETLKFLARRANIELESLSPEEEIIIQKSLRKKEILAVAAQFYHDELVKNNYEDSLGYIKERGFTKEILDSFMVGLAGKHGLRDYLIKSGFTEEEGIEVGVLAVKDGQVYEFFQDRLVFPVLVKEEVIFITARTLIKDFEPKWLHLKGAINNLLNEDILQTEVDVLICEGPSDTLTAIMKGYNAVGILGALAFKPEYHDKFNKVKQVYVCLDADDTGKKGVEVVAKAFMGEEKIIELPEGQDLSDYFKTHAKDDFEELKQQAKNRQERLLDKEKPIRIHLMDVDDAKFSDKKVETDMMICAKGDTFHVPRIFSARCERDCRNNICPINKKTRKIHIPSNSKDLIDFTRFTDARITARLRALSPCPEGTRGRISIEILERITVQEVLVIPKVSKIEAKVEGDKVIDVDDLGREYRDKKIFALTSLPKTNQYFRGYGWVKSSPKSQIATLLLYKLEPITNDYENFQLTDEVKKKLEVFQVSDNYTIESKLGEILEDVTNNITKIYGEHRKRVLLCMLLTYCSQIEFEFDGEMLRRGWVEMVLIGDTGQGKTQMYDNLSKAIGLGEFISGTSATRTGISYSYQQTSDTWFLKWGKYPLNDGRLLFIDEGQCLSIDEWNKMSSGRSDGIIRADGIKQGEAPTRTRLIVSCNPKDNRILDDNMCGVETLKYIFRGADIRRFDVPIFMSSGDQKADVVNVPKDKRSSSKQIITPRMLRHIVCWAWTRKAEDIVFEEEAKDRVYEIAKELTALYGAAKDIPLVTTDIRHKIARLSVALAKLVYSTDAQCQKAIVKLEHVEYIGKLLQEIFNHENCCLNFYAELRKEHSTLTEEEFREFLEVLVRQNLAKEIGDIVVLSENMRLIFLDFANNEIIERSQLAESLDIEADSVTRKLKILKDYKLIKGRSGKRGYRKTPKFNKILRRLLLTGYLKKE